jgi:acyl dehydratase
MPFTDTAEAPADAPAKASSPAVAAAVAGATVGAADNAAIVEAPIQTGEKLGRMVRYSAQQVIDFARMSFDTNPLHRDEDAARQASYTGIIASGQQTAAMMMGMVASYFSRDDDGVAREMLCLNFNFAFKAPIHPGEDVTMRWSVLSVDYNARLGGWIGQLSGAAACNGIDCVVSRGTVLVKLLP